MRIINFAIPIAYAFGVILGGYILMLFSLIVAHTGVSDSTASMLGGWLTLVCVVAAALTIVIRKVNLRIEWSGKSIAGHALLAVGNFAAVATTVGPVVYGYLKGHPEYGMLMWFSLPVFFVNLFLWPIAWMLATSTPSRTVWPKQPTI